MRRHSRRPVTRPCWRMLPCVASCAKGKSARVRVRAINTSSSAFTVESGRTLLDSSGLLWRVETPAAVPAGGEATFEASQCAPAPSRIP